MDYEKEYKEALEKARSLNDKFKDSILGKNIEFIFPELKESEDEKIRKEIIEYHKEQAFFDGKQNNKHVKYVAWLEKQGEQKPAWSEDDERIYQSIMDDTVQENQLNDKQTNWLRGIKYRYFSQPKQEWSEEDERNFDWLMTVCERIHYKSDPQVAPDSALMLKDWLKSIKDRVQPKQEWSEEDENNILFLTSIIEECFKNKEKITLCGDTVCASFTKENVIDRLKSLKPHSTWKPSDEQMEALEHFIVYHNGSTNYAKDLEELRLQLKKLREE